MNVAKRTHAAPSSVLQRRIYLLLTSRVIATVTCPLNQAKHIGWIDIREIRIEHQLS